ncbi:hypothetical protein BB559_001584 [Furculomyces boomerangus]|uniref:Uncharacterized protein n=2 Tax=Harpellales TaxID=61421 RepID=A0A2T9Z1F8_9FUNG|nr:hypothetical protein BB559_007192 [Furculomyces boomerangus]PVU98427.1 hypothetical protein BB559_001584 [Furculomyces boomerangus]PWA01060.1 hypothetical protein BB558_002864 [Smittium angustum]
MKEKQTFARKKNRQSSEELVTKHVDWADEEEIIKAKSPINNQQTKPHRKERYRPENKRSAKKSRENFGAKQTNSNNLSALNNVPDSEILKKSKNNNQLPKINEAQSSNIKQPPKLGFMVGSSRESSINEKNNHSYLSSWQTTATNTATSSVEIYNLQHTTINNPNTSSPSPINENSDSENYINSATNSPQLIATNQDLPQTDNTNTNLPNPKIELLENNRNNQTTNFAGLSKPSASTSLNTMDHNKENNTHLDPLISQKNEMYKKGTTKMFMVSSESSVSDVDPKNPSNTPIQPRDAIDQVGSIHSSSSSCLLKTSQRICTDLSQLNSLQNSASSSFSESLKLRNDLQITPLREIKQTNQEDHNLEDNKSSDKIPINKENETKQPDTPLPEIKDTHFSVDILDENVYLKSSTYKAAQLQRQKIQQQNQNELTELHLEMMHSNMMSITGNQSKYVASLVTSLISDLEPMHKEVQNFPKQFYNWAKITGRPYEHSVLRSAHLSKRAIENKLTSNVGARSGISISSRYDNPKDIKRFGNENSFDPDSPRNRQSLDIPNDFEKIWDGLMPPDQDIETKPGTNGSKGTTINDNLDSLQWFRPLSHNEMSVYYVPKRTELYSNEVLERNYKCVYTSNSYMGVPGSGKYSNSILTINSKTENVLQQPKRGNKGNYDDAGIVNDWTSLINTLAEESSNPKNNEKKPLPGIFVPIDYKLQPSYLVKLINAKSELRLARRTMITAIREKIPQPPRLVTHSVSTLETWKGRRVPGLLNLDIYGGSSFIPEIKQLSNGRNYNETKTKRKGSKGTDTSVNGTKNKNDQRSIINQTSLALRKVRYKASKGIPLELLNYKAADMQTLERMITDYYQGVALNSETVADHGGDGGGYKNTSSNHPGIRVQRWTDLTMPATRILAIPQKYNEKIEYSVGKAGTGGSSQGLEGKSSDISGTNSPRTLREPLALSIRSRSLLLQPEQFEQKVEENEMAVKRSLLKQKENSVETGVIAEGGIGPLSVGNEQEQTELNVNKEYNNELYTSLMSKETTPVLNTNSLTYFHRSFSNHSLRDSIRNELKSKPTAAITETSLSTAESPEKQAISRDGSYSRGRRARKLENVGGPSNSPRVMRGIFTIKKQ